MKLSMAAATVAVMASMAGCDGPKAPAESPSAAAADTGIETAPSPSAAAVPSPHAVPVSVATPGAPAFAAVYPGAQIEGEPTVANGAGGEGGIVTFVTDAPPDQVVAFYRQRAEDAGLASVMEMNQGDARAYGAAKDATGASVQVVASPTDDAETSVQMSWSAGQ